MLASQDGVLLYYTDASCSDLNLVIGYAYASGGCSTRLCVPQGRIYVSQICPNASSASDAMLALIVQKAPGQTFARETSFGVDTTCRVNPVTTKLTAINVCIPSSTSQPYYNRFIEVQSEAGSFVTGVQFQSWLDSSCTKTNGAFGVEAFNQCFNMSSVGLNPAMVLVDLWTAPGGVLQTTPVSVVSALPTAVSSAITTSSTSTPAFSTSTSAFSTFSFSSFDTTGGGTSVQVGAIVGGIVGALSIASFIWAVYYFLVSRRTSESRREHLNGNPQPPFTPPHRGASDATLTQSEPQDSDKTITVMPIVMHESPNALNIEMEKKGHGLFDNPAVKAAISAPPTFQTVVSVQMEAFVPKEIKQRGGPSTDVPTQWSARQVYDWASQDPDIGKQIALVMFEHGVDGRFLFQLTGDNLKNDFGLTKIAKRFPVMDAINRIRPAATTTSSEFLVAEVGLPNYTP
ncbi:hypothetical protein BC830DRAFT_1147060 [Chytriomyces sp. MP71]|nr:hypothetical protein BC830DRAFT_1147060 [Chytriomyces sp. MP71]